jgi:uncharacterized protein (TIGR02246 family)
LSTALASIEREVALDAFHGFNAALNSGNLPAAAAFFTRDGCLVTPDGTAIHGRPEIAAILAQMIDRHTEIRAEQLVVRTAGDVALASGHLTLCSKGPEGARLEQSCTPTIAIRRVEGSWKIAILAPWRSP